MPHSLAIGRWIFVLALMPAAATLAQDAAPEVASAEATAADPLLIAEPPTARPGECWAVLYVPPRYEKHTETVLKTPAGERIEKKPARYEWVELVVTIPAGKRRVVTRPAEYEITEEKVLVTPAGSRAVKTPARFRTVEERVPGKIGAVLKPNPVTGELCLVEGPVEYRIVRRQVLVEPARSEPVDHPARYQSVHRKKLIREAETKLVASEERQVRKRVRRLVEPESEVVVPVAAVYEDASRLVQIQAGHSEWRSVLCETNVTRNLLRRVQQALRAAGENPGSVDGSWGAQSARALRNFQGKSGLAEGGLTMEALDKLGVTVGA